MFLKTKCQQWLWVKKELKVNLRSPLISGGIFPLRHLDPNVQRKRGSLSHILHTSPIQHPFYHIKSLRDDPRNNFLNILVSEEDALLTMVGFHLMACVHLVKDSVFLLVTITNKLRASIVAHFWQMNKTLWYTFQGPTVPACYLRFIPYFPFLPIFSFVLFIHLFNCIFLQKPSQILS